MPVMNAPKAAPSSSHAYRQRTFALNDTAGQLQALRDDGFALVPGVLSADEVATTRAEIDRLRPFLYDRSEVGKPGGVDHYKCVFNRDPFWLQYLDRPGVIDLAEASMGNECHIIGMSAWRSYPNPTPGQAEVDGLSPYGIHTDHNFIEVNEDLLMSKQVVLPIHLCTAHYYLCDITLELCPTWVVPGSHLSGRPLRAKGDRQLANVAWRDRKIEPVLVKAGDVLFWHSGSRNRTVDQIRYLLQVHYGNRMVAQKFSPYLNFSHSEHVVSQANERQKRILGNHQPSAYD